MDHNELTVLVLPTSFIVSTPFNKYKIQTSSKIHKILLNLKQEQPEQQSDELTGGEGKAGVCLDREIEQRAVPSFSPGDEASQHPQSCTAADFHPSSSPLRFALPVWLIILSSKTHTSALAQIQTHIHLRIFFPICPVGAAAAGSPVSEISLPPASAAPRDSNHPPNNSPWSSSAPSASAKSRKFQQNIKKWKEAFLKVWLVPRRCCVPSLNKSLEGFCCLSSLFPLLCVRYNPEADNCAGLR